MGGLALAGLLGLAPLAAAAETAPAGMVPYDHPVYHNGKRVLWHGAGRDEADDSGKNAPVRNDPAKPKPAATTRHEFTLLIDGDDVCASRMATDFVNAMKAAGVRARVGVGRTGSNALKKLVGNDIADVAIVPIDALGRRRFPRRRLEGQGALYRAISQETVEIVAPRSVANLAALNGRTVAVGPADSADEAVAQAVFAKLGVKPKWIAMPLTAGLADLAAGKVDAVVATGEAEFEVAAGFRKDGRFHLVAIPWSPALHGAYAPVTLTARARPNLIGADEKVDTISAPMALIALDAAPGSSRAALDADVVAAMFDKYEGLIGPNDAPIGARSTSPRQWIGRGSARQRTGREPPGRDRRVARGVPAAREIGRGGRRRARRGGRGQTHQSLMQWRGAGP